MMNHLHTKSQNADKVQALIAAVHKLHQVTCTSHSHGMRADLMRSNIESLNALANEADEALAQLREQVGVK